MADNADDGSGGDKPPKRLEAAPMPKQQPLTRVELNEGIKQGQPTGPGNVRVRPSGDETKKK